ncbi:MAG: hypothetical protein ACTS4V_00550 [Candidatus Hodgkinia cicadicola]
MKAAASAVVSWQTPARNGIRIVCSATAPNVECFALEAPIQTDSKPNKQTPNEPQNKTNGVNVFCDLETVRNGFEASERSLSNGRSARSGIWLTSAEGPKRAEVSEATAEAP